MTKIKIGIIGFGTVGSGVFKVLNENKQEILAKTGKTFEVVSVLDLDKEKIESITNNPELIADSFDDLLSKSDIVLELIGGTTIAYEFVKKVIQASKPIVTANKALIALHGKELFTFAELNNTVILYEAAVAGGIPIIKAVREGLASNKIEWVAGILNGTTNYILSEMKNNGLSFDTALKQAQELGYAEADPTFDIEGIDAAHKITIIASLAFGVALNFNSVYTEGITKLQLKDVNYAEGLGYSIKLLGVAKKSNDGIEVRVNPTLIPKERLVANVDGPMNAVLVMGNMLGPTLYYGAGAGSEPTASAVVTDVIDLGRVTTDSKPSYNVPAYGFQNSEIKDCEFLKINQITSGYYLRASFVDSAGVLAKITSFFAAKNLSIDEMHQKVLKKNEKENDVIIVINKAKELDIDIIIEEIQSMESNVGNVIKIRLENLSK
jgi:homoserine dehydrogenase